MILAGPSKSITAVPRHRPRVVVLCAEERLRQLLTYWLNSMPLDVTTATNGRSAADVLARHGGEVVLVTDRTLPPWPGLPPLPVLKQQNPSLRIVVIDGGAAGPMQAHGPSLSGADVTVTRPFSRLALRRSILATG